MIAQAVTSGARSFERTNKPWCTIVILSFVIQADNNYADLRIIIIIIIVIIIIIRN